MSDPEFMGTVFDHVASGGSVIALCRTLDIKYANLLAWIHNNPERDKKYKEALSARAEWAMERVLHEIQMIGTVDIRRAYSASGELLNPKDMPEDVARALASIDVNDNPITGVSTRIKLIDKLKALELMGKNFGMFIDRHEIDIGKQTLEQLVSGSMPPKPAPIETTATQEDKPNGN